MSAHKFSPPPPVKPKEDLLASDKARSFILNADAPAAATPAATDSKKKSSAGQGASTFPWEEGDPRFLQTVMLRIPETEYLMLKWLAGTTYGMSQNGLALAALREHMTKMFEERGFIVETADTGLLQVRKP